jgi:hypothetical protein
MCQDVLTRPGKRPDQPGVLLFPRKHMPRVNDLLPNGIGADSPAHQKHLRRADDVAGFQMRHHVIQHPPLLWEPPVKVSDFVDGLHRFTGLV